MTDSVSLGKARTRGNSRKLPTEETSDPILRRVKLKLISGLHPAIEAVQQELAIPPFKLPTAQAGKDLRILEMLQRNPVFVVNDGRQLRCVANVRLFLAARSLLQAEDAIYCIEYFHVDPQKIKADFIAELLYLPAIAGIHFSEVKILAAVAHRANLNQLWEAPQAPIGKYVAALYGVDPRQLAHTASITSSETDATTPPQPALVESLEQKEVHNEAPGGSAR